MRPILSRRQSVSYVSAISNTRPLRVMVLTKAIDAPTRITCCKRVCKDAARKVYLIRDHLKVHKAATVKAWLAANAAQIAVFYHLGQGLADITPRIVRADDGRIA